MFIAALLRQRLLRSAGKFLIVIIPVILYVSSFQESCIKLVSERKGEARQDVRTVVCQWNERSYGTSFPLADYGFGGGPSKRRWTSSLRKASSLFGIVSFVALRFAAASAAVASAWNTLGTSIQQQQQQSTWCNSSGRVSSRWIVTVVHCLVLTSTIYFIYTYLYIHISRSRILPWYWDEVVSRKWVTIMHVAHSIWERLTSYTVW